MSYWGTIPFGKYQNKHFEEIDDIKYLKWYIGKLNNDMQIRHCAKAIIRAVNKKHQAREKRNEQN